MIGGPTNLLIEAHRAHRVRVVDYEGRGDCRARIRFDGIFPVVERVVPRASLHPDTPLSDAEEREYRVLDAGLAGQFRPLKAQYDRLEVLRLRWLMHREPAHG